MGRNSQVDLNILQLAEPTPTILRRDSLHTGLGCLKWDKPHMELEKSGKSTSPGSFPDAAHVQL